jgi:two-component system response regulator HydG
VAGDVAELLRKYPWPGNVRQLRNVVERAVVLSKGDCITMKDLPAELFPSDEKKSPSEEGEKTVNSDKTLRELEFQAIKDALDSCNGNKSKAARASAYRERPYARG